MKKIQAFIVILALITIFFPFKISAQETQPKRVLFINQVRGTECCDKGSTDSLNQQIKEFTENELPATFTIRYDALIDPDFQEVLKKMDTTQFEVGLLLEITPQLAIDSGVEYTGKPEDWYQAQHVYTIGYKEEDRKKLIDTLFSQFHRVFGYYPQTTTGWMVDTNSINYMKSDYGVKIHQLTREQWGTDSYTLYGGPFHYPYFASKNWALNPDSCTDDQLTKCKEDATLIVRQTVSDPLRNYGDSNSAFTSQPNDYVRDGKDFSYFEKLLTQTLNQSQNAYSVAILGLENSMDTPYQAEFGKQIRWIAEYREKKPEMLVLKASDFYQEFLEKWASDNISSMEGKNLTDDQSVQTVWITTPKYRVRVLQKDHEVALTDIRIYSEQMTDPYNSYMAQHLGYWVIPFLVDGSRFRTSVEETAPPFNFSQYIQKTFFGNPEVSTVSIPSWKSDFTPEMTPASIKLPHSTDKNWSLESNKNSEALKITYFTDQGKQVTLFFNTNQFSVLSPEISSTINDDYLKNIVETPFIQLKKMSEKNRALAWVEENSKATFYELLIECKEPSTCTFTPSFSDSFDWINFSQSFSPYLFPEKTLPPDDKKTSLNVKDQYVIAGRNPVRIELIPRDMFGFSTTSTSPLELNASPPINDYFVSSVDSDGIIDIDVVENKVGKYEVEIKYDKINQKETIYFSPNCNENFWYCVRHPQQASWYLRSRVNKYKEN